MPASLPDNNTWVEQRLSYNGRIEAMRELEYPMLNGITSH